MQGFEKKTISSSSQDAQRLRDLIRISSLKDIATALGAYYSDREKYPDAIPSGCINTKELTHNYMPRGVPSDPINGRLTLGCDGTDNMTFAYRS